MKNQQAQSVTHTMILQYNGHGKLKNTQWKAVEGQGKGSE